MAMRKQTLDELEPFFAACKVLKINPEKWLSDVLDTVSYTHLTLPTNSRV